MSSLVTALSARISPPIAAAVFWAAVACCVIAQAAILRSALGRKGTRPASARPARRLAEAAWAILPALALAVVLVMTWRRVSAERPAAGRAVEASAAGALP